MHYFEFSDVNAALPRLAAELLNNGEEVGSRLGERVNELTHVAITLAEPTNRYIVVPGRRASLPAQVAETLWVLSGRNDIAWLSHYLKRAGDFSDDGETWRGAYGPRLRQYGDYHGVGNGVDQLAHVVRLLSEDPLTRRAVIGIYDPVIDAKPGKDIPCNDFIQFTSRLGRLDMHVYVRSNDLIWGWSGINQFEWSALQEIVAGMLGIAVGSLNFSIGSLHVYDRHWKKADQMAEASTRSGMGLLHAPRFDPAKAEELGYSFDELVGRWFLAEEFIRSFPQGTRVAELIEEFPEPMLRSWLAVIAAHWSGRTDYLEPYKGTELYAAMMESPLGPTTRKPKTGNEPLMAILDEATLLPAGEVGSAFDKGGPLPTQGVDLFTRYVSELHAKKHAAYGDSWKRRGEQISILANIARKVDRLGVDDDLETSADTAIDLMVYCLKYRLWLTDEHDVAIPDVVREELPYQAGTKYSDGTAAVDVLLGSMPKVLMADEELRHLEHRLVELFNELSYALDLEPHDADRRAQIAELMARIASLVARTRWTAEQRESVAS